MTSQLSHVLSSSHTIISTSVYPAALYRSILPWFNVCINSVLTSLSASLKLELHLSIISVTALSLLLPITIDSVRPFLSLSSINPLLVHILSEKCLSVHLLATRRFIVTSSSRVYLSGVGNGVSL